MNDNNKQVILFFAITVLAVSVVIEFGSSYIASLTNDKMYNIKKNIENEKELARKEEEKKVAEKIEKEKALSNSKNNNNAAQNETNTDNKVNNNTNNNDSGINNEESLRDIIDGSSKNDKTKDDCFTKNGKLYFKGVCVPIPKGFKYLMKEKGFMAYTDASYRNIFMVYVDEHSMDNAKDGIEAFTYGIGTVDEVKSGPKNMKFGKNLYQRYVLETEGIKTYAFITASNNKVAYIHVIAMNGSISWAKNSLAYLTYYN